MTNVNELLRRTLAEGEAWKQAAQERSESYIEDNDTSFKEAHEYLDCQSPLKVESPDDRATQAQRFVIEHLLAESRRSDDRLTRLEGVVWEIVKRLHAEPNLRIGDYLDILRALKEAE